MITQAKKPTSGNLSDLPNPALLEFALQYAYYWGFLCAKFGERDHIDKGAVIKRNSQACSMARRSKPYGPVIIALSKVNKIGGKERSEGSKDQRQSKELCFCGQCKLLNHP